MSFNRADVDRILATGPPGLLPSAQAATWVLDLITLAINVCDSEALRFLRRFFTPVDYDALIEERGLAQQCGYPTCPNRLRDSHGNLRQRGRSTVLPWQRDYCQVQCYRASTFFREQLGDVPTTSRTQIASAPYGALPWENDVLLLPEVLELARISGRSPAETVAAMVRQRGLEARLQQLEIDAPEKEAQTSVKVTERK